MVNIRNINYKLLYVKRDCKRWKEASVVRKCMLNILLYHFVLSFSLKIEQYDEQQAFFVVVVPAPFHIIYKI